VWEWTQARAAVEAPAHHYERLIETELQASPEWGGHPGPGAVVVTEAYGTQPAPPAPLPAAGGGRNSGLGPGKRRVKVLGQVGSDGGPPAPPSRTVGGALRGSIRGATFNVHPRCGDGRVAVPRWGGKKEDTLWGQTEGGRTSVGSNPF